MVVQSEPQLTSSIDVANGSLGAKCVSWDRAYEWRAVLLLSLGFGLVALDRFLILPMFPVIRKDLGLDYADLGNITGALAITWGVSALAMGSLSDMHGRRRIVVGAMITFSLLVGLSGLAQGVASLIFIRALMGIAEGAYVPPSIAATLEASRPDRHGLNIGLQQVAAPLFGLGIAPIVVTQLMRHVDWRWIFFVVALPGAVVAWLLQRTLQEAKKSDAAKHSVVRDIANPKFRKLLTYRNVPLAGIGMICGLNSLIVLSAFLPSYCVDRLGLTSQTMGFVMSAVGFGGVIGTVLIPALSDYFGRRLAMIISSAGATLALLILARIGAAPLALFACLFFAALCNYALLVLIVGPVSMEAVPLSLRATASGAVIAVGEIFGGGIAPSIAGYTARHFGIDYIFHLAVGGLVIAVLTCFALKETAPRLVRVAAD